MTNERRRQLLATLFLIALCAACLPLTACAANTSTIVQELIIVFTGIPALVATAGILIPGPVGRALTTISAIVATALNLVLKALTAYHNNPSDANLAALQSSIHAAHTQVGQYNAAVQITDPPTAAKFAAFGQTAITTLANLEASTVAKHDDTKAAAQQASADGL